MNFKTLLTLFFTVTITTTFPPLKASAHDFSITPIAIEEISDNTIVPFYTYVQTSDIGVYPNSTGTKYHLNITGISSVTSISGTTTLYKCSASGSYVKIDSEKLNLKGSRIRYTGYLKSSGSGKYKIEFIGTINSSSGSESVTFRSYGSY